MKRVTGIGGVFIKSPDAPRLRAWYERHLGIEFESWGGHAFSWTNPHNPDGHGTTTWSIIEMSAPYFAPSQAQFMINYRVDNLHALLDALRSEGCQVEDKIEESDFGKFGWVIDPDGNKIELWEPPAGK